MLKYTGVKLELLPDPDMYIASENALRGGVCAVTHRHAKANNRLPNTTLVSLQHGYATTTPTTCMAWP